MLHMFISWAFIVDDCVHVIYVFFLYGSDTIEGKLSYVKWFVAGTMNCITAVLELLRCCHWGGGICFYLNTTFFKVTLLCALQTILLGNLTIVAYLLMASLQFNTDLHS